MNSIATLLTLSCLLLLGSSRLRVAIRMVAFQGLLLGLLQLFAVGPGHLTPGLVILSITSIVLKSGLLPWLLNKAMIVSGTKREIEPFISFGASMLCGVFLLAVSGWIVSTLLETDPIASPVALTCGFFLVFSGLLLLMTRRKALTQTLGFLVLENGVFTTGLSLGSEFSTMVELGILLDVFVGIFLMGIMLFHIDREFDHLDADRFNELSDLEIAATVVEEADE
ncbi:MAG TPA: hydrogenase [Candidatus Rifleibacterium sp.]|nr:hydrogenase [Candidatus Rifleibacterium sp.]HPT48503.1 hydrogenase [Candidatus Rifleibacterium sp.]